VAVGKSGIEEASRWPVRQLADKSSGAVFKLTKEPENLHDLTSEMAPIMGEAFPGLGLYFGAAASL
jgi:hypothetical protein